MDDPCCIEIVGLGDDGFSDFGSAGGDFLEFKKEFWPCELVDSAVDSAAASHPGVGGIDDDFSALIGD